MSIVDRVFNRSMAPNTRGSSRQNQVQMQARPEEFSPVSSYPRNNYLPTNLDGLDGLDEVDTFDLDINTDNVQQVRENALQVNNIMDQEQDNQEDQEDNQFQEEEEEPGMVETNGYFVEVDEDEQASPENAYCFY